MVSLARCEWATRVCWVLSDGPVRLVRRAPAQDEMICCCGVMHSYDDGERGGEGSS